MDIQQSNRNSNKRTKAKHHDKKSKLGCGVCGIDEGK